MSSTASTSGSDASSSAGGSGAVHSVHSAIHSNQYAQQAGAFFSPDYQSPFFDCLTDPTGCLLVCCCPCVPMAALKSGLDSRQQTLVDLCCCPNPYQMRQTIRAKYGIPFSPLNDVAGFCCCPCCFIHQDVREFAAREGKPPRFHMF